MQQLARLLGMIVGGTIAVGFLSLIVRWVLKKLLRNHKDPLAISCTIAVLMAIAFFTLISRGIDAEAILCYGIGGFIAFNILTRRFKSKAFEGKEQG